MNFNKNLSNLSPICQHENASILLLLPLLYVTTSETDLVLVIPFFSLVCCTTQESCASTAM